MKKLTALSLSLSLALGTIGTAHADWDRHDGYRPAPHYRHYDEHRGGNNWIGPAAVLAIAGLAIGAAVASHSAPPTAPVYSVPAYPAPAYSAPVYAAPAYNPPAPTMPEVGSWYYCDSAGQYYPYVRSCPEGWQAVMPPR
jgi:hypothetical protein